MPVRHQHTSGMPDVPWRTPPTATSFQAPASAHRTCACVYTCMASREGWLQTVSTDRAIRLPVRVCKRILPRLAYVLRHRL